MAEYRLSNKAVEDLDSIWLYTFENWSEQQADNYFNEILDACKEIVGSDVNTDREYSSIKKGLYGHHCRRHIIFYRYSSGKNIDVIRILHERMDFETKF